MADPQDGINLADPDDPLARLKAKKRGVAPVAAESTATGDPLARLKAKKAAAESSPGGIEGILDAGLNQLTFGLHQKGIGATDALIDILTHGTNAHPIDTYKASTEGTRQRVATANKQHPLATTAAEATGFFAPLALEAPIRGLLGAKNLAEESIPAAGGLRGALKRIGTNTAIGGAAGAGLTGIASDSPLEDRPKQMVAGGILGTLLGGGTTAAAEGLSAAASGANKLFRSADTKGADAARQQIVARLRAGNLTPESLLENAKAAQETGGAAVAAHLGGPALDDLSYLGASSMSPSGAAFKGSLEAAQRGEHDLLQRGVTALSGRENVPKNTTTGFLNELETGRSEAGARDYPLAYKEAPVADDRILTAIRNDPDLRAALEHGLSSIQREDELARLQTGKEPPVRANPLTEAPTGISTAQRDYLKSLNYSPETIDAVLAQMGGNGPTASAPALPVKLLDYMKRGVEPVIQQKAAREGLQSRDADVIRAKVQEMLGRVDETRPAYQAARARQASYFGREEGAQAGTKAFQKTGPEIGQALTELARPGQQEAYRTAATSTLRDLINAKRDNADIGTSLFSSPQSRGQLDAIYGAGARERFEPYLEQGGTLNRVLKAATGGSQTEPRQAVRAAVKEAGGGATARMIGHPHRAIYNIPGKIADAHEQRIQSALTETLARELNIPAGSPELAGLVDRLYQSIPFERRAPNPLFDASKGAGLGLLTRLGAAGGTAVGGRP